MASFSSSMALTGTLDKAATTSSAPVTSADEDWSYVERVQAGDVAAFDFLVTKYRERLFSIVYNMTSNREDAADLTQEAFIKAFSSIKRFRGKSSFFTWLYRIAVNTTLSQLKKHRLRRFFSLENLHDEATSSEIVETLSEGGKAERRSLASELQEKLNEALQKLSPKHRTVVVLFEIEGLSHQEISEIMGCSVGTVRSRLHYAKQQLQAYLQDYIR
ncbi:MAG: sigma-70 family RNA polymerase sigma factor [Verrucomicrobiota bacterium JB022]|nr:sigma-70 family RNA polymerase sigma factor [Verrucomicrobiota bacterium JB022]